MKKLSFCIFVIIAISIRANQLSADDKTFLIPQVPPDALILLDLSGSMNFDPQGVSCQTPGCTRLEIAKDAIFKILDDNKDDMINRSDEDSLGIRLGYMRFHGCLLEDPLDYVGGCNRLIKEIGSPYDDIWDTIRKEAAFGPTPLASALDEAKLYLDVHKAQDEAKSCRQKFVILITDGWDNLSCGGIQDPDGLHEYKRRRRSVSKVKALTDAGYKLFVIGFGAGMPHYLKNTLNWMAYFGRTDNHSIENSGDITSYSPAADSNCENSAYASHDLGDDPDRGIHYYATSNDPGEATLDGYAFIAENPSQLSEALKAIVKYIQGESSYFTAAAVPFVRTKEKEVAYLSSFVPKEAPFWEGSLKGYRLETDGTLKVDTDGNPTNPPEWVSSVPTNRTIKTYRRGELTDFNSSNLTKEDLDVKDEIEKDRLISYIKSLKLGDILHSNAVIVGEPPRFFEDEGFSGKGGFYEINKDRTRIILVGANDGMLHAFNATTGVEEWAFIPDSLLKTLRAMLSTHTYYVDSTPKAADVWFYSSPTDATKRTDEWKTVLICGLGKGGKTYFALDITDTLNPKYLWEFPKPTDPVNLAKVGQSWSVPAIGKVKIEQGDLVERWVAFVGGGFDPGEKGDQRAAIGRAFFVIDIKSGEIIWEFSYDERVEAKKEMAHCLPSPPTAVDTNSDGFIDKVFIGDLGGQMWVFDISFDEASKKSQSQWSGKILFKVQSEQAEKHPIYHQPAVAFDEKRNSWVFFGTGDKENPTDKNSQERFYAIKDAGDDQLKEKDLVDITMQIPGSFAPAEKGWLIRLEKGEKVLTKPTVFNRLVYFTTYRCMQVSDPCSETGSAKLYVMEFLSGAGALAVDDLSDFEGIPSQRSKKVGIGASSQPVVTVSTKGQASVTIVMTTGQIFSAPIFSPSTSKQILYWREVIP